MSERPNMMSVNNGGIIDENVREHAVNLPTCDEPTADAAVHPTTSNLSTSPDNESHEDIVPSSDQDDLFSEISSENSMESIVSDSDNNSGHHQVHPNIPLHPIVTRYSVSVNNAYHINCAYHNKLIPIEAKRVTYAKIIPGYTGCAIELSVHAAHKVIVNNILNNPDEIDALLLEHRMSVNQYFDIPMKSIPHEILNSNFFKIFILAVHSPYKFWFNIMGITYCIRREMRLFYSSLSHDDMLMNPAFIRPGQVCAALHAGNWHRGRILTKPLDCLVKVFFVDYGTVSYVCISNIKFLMRMFVEIPQQSFRGCLSHVRPINNLWSREALQYFNRFVSHEFYAKVTEVNPVRNVYNMVLFDEPNEQSTTINQNICSTGHAMSDEEYYTTVAENHPRKKHIQEIYPTHQFLELGAFPNLIDIDIYQEDGYDYFKETYKFITNIANKYNTIFYD